MNQLFGYLGFGLLRDSRRSLLPLFETPSTLVVPRGVEMVDWVRAHAAMIFDVLIVGWSHACVLVCESFDELMDFALFGVR